MVATRKYSSRPESHVYNSVTAGIPVDRDNRNQVYERIPPFTEDFRKPEWMMKLRDYFQGNDRK